MTHKSEMQEKDFMALGNTASDGQQHPPSTSDERDDRRDWEYEEECEACGGEGYYHDCGDDICCCAAPHEDDIFPCQDCGGSGYLSA
jgi:hypothetical protein